MPVAVRLKEIEKRRALTGKQTVELLIHPVGLSRYGVNSAGKRTVVINSTSLNEGLNHSFFICFKLPAGRPLLRYRQLLRFIAIVAEIHPHSKKFY